jgi:hypothetical protein
MDKNADMFHVGEVVSCFKNEEGNIVAIFAPSPSPKECVSSKGHKSVRLFSQSFADVIPVTNLPGFALKGASIVQQEKPKGAALEDLTKAQLIERMRALEAGKVVQVNPQTPTPSATMDTGEDTTSEALDDEEEVCEEVVPATAGNGLPAFTFPSCGKVVSHGKTLLALIDRKGNRDGLIGWIGKNHPEGKKLKVDLAAAETYADNTPKPSKA